MVTAEQLADEALRARKVRHLVDLATSLIMQAAMTRDEAEKLVSQVRSSILHLFPGCDETYEIIYAPRFRRIIEEFTRPRPAAGGTVLLFPARS